METYYKTKIDDYFPQKPSDGIGSLLDEPMPADPHAALADEDNIIRAVTVTLRPSLHGENPLSIRKRLRDYVKNFACGIRKKHTFYCCINSEYTQACVIHFHGYIVGRKSAVARLLAELRRSYGYCCCKEPYNLQGWIAYCNKDNDHPKMCFIS